MVNPHNPIADEIRSALHTTLSDRLRQELNILRAATSRADQTLHTPKLREDILEELGLNAGPEHLRIHPKPQKRSRPPKRSRTEEGPRHYWEDLPDSVGEALDKAEADFDVLINTTVQEITSIADQLIDDPPIRNAALARSEITTHWPWPPYIDNIAELLIYLRPSTQNSASQYWPAHASPAEVTHWARNKINTLADGEGDKLVKHAELGGGVRDCYLRLDQQWIRYPGTGLALMYLAIQDVERGRQRPAIAIDAGQPHHNLLIGWRDMPKDPKEDGGLWQVGDYLELMAPTEQQSCGVQLALPLALGFHDAAIRALQQLRGWDGLRHWAGMLRLFAVEGGRQGWVRWTMQDHLNALGLSKRVRENPARLLEIATEVELLTQLELAMITPSGEVRTRAPLIHVGTKYDTIAGSRFQLDGMELRINPMLYSGVRNMETGKLGRDSFPAPVDLARIDHARRPYALALSLLLPIRWRWALWNGKDHLPLSAGNLLKLGGITYRRRRASLAWNRLNRSFEELQHIQQLDHVEWDGEPFNLNTTCRLYPAQWIVDRACRDVTPNERPPMDIPRTSKELRHWRNQQGWSQRDTARRLKVSHQTISRAERAPDGALPKRLIRAFETWGGG